MLQVSAPGKTRIDTGRHTTQTTLMNVSSRTAALCLSEAIVGFAIRKHSIYGLRRMENHDVNDARRQGESGLVRESGIRISLVDPMGREKPVSASGRNGWSNDPYILILARLRWLISQPFTKRKLYTLTKQR